MTGGLKSKGKCGLVIEMTTKNQLLKDSKISNAFIKSSFREMELFTPNTFFGDPVKKLPINIYNPIIM